MTAAWTEIKHAVLCCRSVFVHLWRKRLVCIVRLCHVAASSNKRGFIKLPHCSVVFMHTLVRATFPLIDLVMCTVASTTRISMQVEIYAVAVFDVVCCWIISLHGRCTYGSQTGCRHKTRSWLGPVLFLFYFFHSWLFSSLPPYIRQTYCKAWGGLL